MGIVSSLKNISVSSAHPKDPAISRWFGNSNSSSAGINVTPDTAKQIIALYACVRIISENVSMLPIHLYRKTTKDDRQYRQLADNLPLYNTLHNKPNRWQTPLEFKELMTAFAVMRGNGYAEIISSGANSVAELIPLHPDRVTPFKAPNNTIAYAYQPETGERRILLKDEVLHLRGLGFDGITGHDPISLSAEALGISIAAERFGGTYFGNGTVVGGVLEHPSVLGDEAYASLKKEFEDRHQGVGNSHKPVILEEGMKWQSVGIEPEKAQFLETRKFQVTEIARMFRVPPHMLADLDRATFSNIEHQSIEFVTQTLMPWLTRWEEAIKRDLMSDSLAKSVYAKFQVKALLKGDTKARFEAYQMAAGGNAPWMDRNEIRALEDLNPKEGLDEMLTPLNMGAQMGGAEEESQQSAPKQDNETENKLSLLLINNAKRIARKEAKKINSIMNKNGDNVAETFKQIRAFYESMHDEIKENLQITSEQVDIYINDSIETLLSLEQDKAKHMLNDWESIRAGYISAFL